MRSLISSKIEFTRHPLVFIEGLKRWVFLHDCVWSGPHLASVYYLSTEFPQCKKLFRDRLKLRNITLDHVIQELECMTSSTSFSRLEELLLLLNGYLRKQSPENCLSKLKGKDIIPIRKPNGTLCRMAYDSSHWYLADRQNCWTASMESFPSSPSTSQQSGIRILSYRLWMCRTIFFLKRKHKLCKQLGT